MADLEARDRRHQSFLQEAELAIPDDLDAAEYGGEKNPHRDDAGSQKLQVIALTGTRKNRTQTYPNAIRSSIGWPSEPTMRAREREYRFSWRSHRI